MDTMISENENIVSSSDFGWSSVVDSSDKPINGDRLTIEEINRVYYGYSVAIKEYNDQKMIVEKIKTDIAQKSLNLSEEQAEKVAKGKTKDEREAIMKTLFLDESQELREEETLLQLLSNDIDLWRIEIERIKTISHLMRTIALAKTGEEEQEPIMS